MNGFQSSDYQNDAESLREENLQLPVSLDEQSIADHLRMISRSNPLRLPATVRTIREKWAYVVGGWAERTRLAYLQTVLQQLQVSHDILSQSLAMNDECHTHEGKRKAQLAESATGIPQLESEAKAEELRLRIETAKAGQAEARKKREKLTQAPASEPSESDRRKERLKNLNEEITRLIARRSEVLAEHLNGRRFDELSSSEQEEYRADENSYGDRIRQAKERRVQAE